MRILMSTVGTRGDVQPVLALALNARDEGHDVLLCLPPNFVEVAADLGFAARPLGIEMRAPRPGETAPTSVPDLVTDQFDTIMAAAEGCDLIVGGGMHQYAVRSAAERFGIPCRVAAYAPTSLPSSSLPPANIPELPGNAADNERLWAENRRAWNARSLEKVNSNRQRWHLGPVDDLVAHILGTEPWLAADPALGPAPSSPGIEIVQPGAWIMADDRPLSPELSRFLDEGEPPVYFGFGSMPASQAVVATLTEAARSCSKRMILSEGWAGLAAIDAAPDCIVIGEVNQQALFPRVAAVVHHGGAGTTTIAAKAGVPQIVTPMFSDQFYWGFRVHQLKLGVAVPMPALSPATLAAALSRIISGEAASEAPAFARRIIPDGAAIAARRLANCVA